jgi:putative DNA primase/helicase
VGCGHENFRAPQASRPQPDGSGKAPATIRENVALEPKMILGTWGVIRLASDDRIVRALAIAEGIENALTAAQIIGWGPVWAAGTADRIRQFPLLPWIECITVFADAEDVGIQAARECATRWRDAGREAIVHVPPEGEDWNIAVARLG